MTNMQLHQTSTDIANVLQQHDICNTVGQTGLRDGAGTQIPPWEETATST